MPAGGLKSKLGSGEAAGNIVMEGPDSFGFPPLKRSGAILRSQVRARVVLQLVLRLGLQQHSTESGLFCKNGCGVAAAALRRCECSLPGQAHSAACATEHAGHYAEAVVCSAAIMVSSGS
jgi:hypothetical protein